MSYEVIKQYWSQYAFIHAARVPDIARLTKDGGAQLESFLLLERAGPNGEWWEEAWATITP
jgi:hypothetical protein